MRAARTVDAKYIRNERIPDEFYRLSADPDEGTNRHGRDDGEEPLAAALSAFEDRVGATWDEDGTAADPLSEMSAGAQDRLRDLGYLE